MPHDLVVLGDLVADLIVPIEHLPLVPNKHGWAQGIFVEPGGAGNVLVAARRMNLRVATLGAIGEDSYGGQMLAMLAAEGVDVTHVTMCPDRATICCMVLTDQLGQHVYLGIKDGKGHWPYSADWPAIIRSARALFTDGYTVRDVLQPPDLLATLQTAREAGVPVFFDPGPSIEFVPPELTAQILSMVDVLLLNGEEAALLCDKSTPMDIAHDLLSRGPSTIVLKRGAAGCLIATADQLIEQPGFAITVVDTVGSGDAFAAAFIAGWLRGGSLRDSATLGNALGALVATQRGAGTRIPSREQLLDLLAGDPAVRALA
jgi:sugar/nucleoside kinase (ribokinase family)